MGNKGGLPKDEAASLQPFSFSIVLKGVTLATYILSLDKPTHGSRNENLLNRQT